MGPVKSVTYNVADEEKGEMAELVTIAFKSQASKMKDNIKGMLLQLDEQRISTLVTNPENANLYEAYNRCV